MDEQLTLEVNMYSYHLSGAVIINGPIMIPTSFFSSFRMESYAEFVLAWPLFSEDPKKSGVEEEGNGLAGRGEI